LDLTKPKDESIVPYKGVPVSNSDDVNELLKKLGKYNYNPELDANFK